MATMTAVQRGKPVYTLPATQQTAPVYEFRCLYTRDLHKKAKKWHDGSLRFHTFNQRVMVYDDGKNFIGDLHYRQEDEFGEGIELQLDRGVKVEVGERLGETQTDLAPLLDRRRPDEAGDARSPQQSRGAVTQQLTTVASQGRPRSIAEVLGASQGRIGRARLPLQSPYEQRQILQPAEPAAKRQKVAAGKENVHQSVLAKTSSKPLGQSKSCTPTPVPPTIEFAEVMEVSSDDDTANRTRQTPKKQQKKPKENAATKSKLKTAKDSRVPSQNEPSSRSEKAQPGVVPKSGMTPLLLTTRPQRPKLFYKSLLPGSTEQNAHQLAERPRNLARSVTSSNNGLDQPLIDANHVGDTAGDDGSDRFPSLELLNVYPTLPNPIDELESISWSPLFVPQIEQNRSPDKSVYSDQSDFTVLSQYQPTPQQTSIGQLGSEVDEIETESLPEETRRDLPLSTAEPDPVLPKTLSMAPPSDLFGPAVHERAPPSQQRRSFRRVRSENDAERDEEEVSEDPGPRMMPPAMPFIQSHSKRSVPALDTSPSKLRRALSDTAVFADLDRETVPDVESPIEGETGPWSSTEAFLLFDWWPAGLEKPDYGPVRDLNDLNARDGPQPLRITTARDMLRDDVHVL